MPLRARVGEEPREEGVQEHPRGPHVLRESGEAAPAVLAQRDDRLGREVAGGAAERHEVAGVEGGVAVHACMGQRESAGLRGCRAGSLALGGVGVQWGVEAGRGWVGALVLRGTRQARPKSAMVAELRSPARASITFSSCAYIGTHRRVSGGRRRHLCALWRTGTAKRGPPGHGCEPRRGAATYLEVSVDETRAVHVFEPS